MEKKKNENNFREIVYPLSLVTQIGVTVSVISGIFILGGKYLDDTLKMSPVFILIGGVIAFIASMYAVYVLVLPVMKKSEDSDKKADMNDNSAINEPK